MVRKRLFLGGLFHEVDAASLSDRFAAFGQISNVDIKTKNDDDGNPFKVWEREREKKKEKKNEIKKREIKKER